MMSFAIDGTLTSPWHQACAPFTPLFWLPLMRWPDRGLPAHLADGFELAGPLPESGVLKPILPTHSGKGFGPTEDEALLGDSTAQFVSTLEHDRRRGKLCQEIWDATSQEISEGMAGPLLSKEQMGQKFGVGQWRPLPRHLVWQLHKWRPIDDVGGRALMHLPRLPRQWCAFRPSSL